MKRISIFLLGIACLLPVVATAQLDHKVTTGALAFDQQDYEKAMEALNAALEDVSKIKDKNRPKAYYFRARTHLALASKLNLQEEYKQVATHVESAYQDLQNGLASDDGKWEKKIKTQLGNPTGLSYLSYAAALMLNNNKAFEQAKELADISVSLAPKNYTYYDNRGSIFLSLNDTMAAKKDLREATKLYGSNPPKVADPYIGYTYYRLAIIDRYAENDLDAALEMLEKGKNALDEADKSLQKNESIPVEQRSQKLALVQQVRNDLTNFELDILLNSPNKLQEALDKFKAKLAQSPDNYVIHVAYASLLEKVDQEEAIKVYNKAIELNPGKESAPFNLGAFYNNIAKGYFDKANEEQDYDKADELIAEGKTYLTKAYESFKLALKANPESCTTVGALVQATITLEMMDEYNKYKALKKELCGN